MIFQGLCILYLTHRVQKHECSKTEHWLSSNQQDVQQGLEHARSNMSLSPDYTDLSVL